MDSHGIILSIMTYSQLKDEAKDASVEASAKPWKHKMCLLVLGPSSSHCSDDVHCYHFGSSIKDAGDRAFMINQVEDEVIVRVIISEMGKVWEAGERLVQKN